MLLCGFEKFENFYVRIDILERLFMQIINSNSEKEKEIKMKPEMLNLLGCNKENFIKLLKKINYKIIKKDKDIYFKYMPIRINYKKSKNINMKDKPFGKLAQLEIK